MEFYKGKKKIRITSWTKIRTMSEAMDTWVFRGEKDSEWTLKTTLDRYVQNYGLDRKKLWNREQWILKEFKRRAHHYLNPPHRHNIIEWIALLRHYGGPTRFLDVTHSFYVAIFFAIEDADEDAVVWAINPNSLEYKAAIEMGINQKEYSDETRERHNSLAAQSIIQDSKRPLVITVEPNLLNERMSIQQGVFLCPCTLEVPFEVCLHKSLDLENEEWQELNEENPRLFDELLKAQLVKLIIPRELHRTILHDLNRMNITTATLYPGLDGFARSLKFHMRIKEEMKFEALEQYEKSMEVLNKECKGIEQDKSLGHIN